MRLVNKMVSEPGWLPDKFMYYLVVYLNSYPIR
jgi:hypothetical protein